MTATDAPGNGSTGSITSAAAAVTAAPGTAPAAGPTLAASALSAAEGDGSRHSHPRHRVDELLTSPVRLSLVAALSRADEIEFGVLRDRIEVSDSVLSKQLAQLEAAGYVAVRKGYVGKRPRTWLTLSAEGRVALNQHLAALEAIVAGE